MSITNINTLQKLAYTGTNKDLQTYSDLYIKQSLANLGQRFTIKGDGVSVSKFAIYELFNNLPSPEESDFAENGKLYSAYMEATVTTDKKDRGADIKLTAHIGEEHHTISLSEECYTVADSDVAMKGSKVKASYNSAPISFYSKGGIVTHENDNYSIMFLTYDADKNPLDITIDRYDNTSSSIIDGIHIYDFNNSTYMTVLSQNGKQYSVSQYVVSNVDMMSIYKMLLDEQSSPVMSNKRNWIPSDVVERIKKDLGEDAVVEFGSCMATYDSESQYLSCDSDSLAGVFETDETQRNLVEANVLEWNDSIALAFPFFKQYYNKQVYIGDDNTSIKRRIVAEVLYALWDNFKKESDSDNVEDAIFIAYLPYEYTFIYTCNSNNQSQIFTSHKDITVESTQNPKDELWKICKTGNEGVREQLIICSSWADTDTTEDIFSLWKYYITYDESDIVKSINVERSFVLPYINDDGYWSINNVDTSIYARGKDGGQPSLIITYSDTSNNRHEIMSTMNKDELTTALSWESTYFRVRPLDTTIDIGEAAFHMMATYMPINVSTTYLPENLVTFLENAIIMSVTSVNSEQTAYSTASIPLSDSSQLGHNGTITTFWALKKDEQTKKYSFTYVRQPDSSWAMDFNYLADSESIIRYYMQLGLEPDLYKHSWVVFDGITSSLKNQETNENRLIYPTIMNRGQEYFTDIFGADDVSKQYRNNANFVPSFVSKINMTGSYISGVEEENSKYDKYFHFDYSDDKSYTYVPVSQVFANDEKTLAYEWYPNVHTVATSAWLDTFLPVVDLKEMFIRNANVFNRYNVLSTDKTGRMYYAYYGTSYENADKRTVRLGTGTTDINLGLKTLTKNEERSKFTPHSELSIDFNKIVTNGDIVMSKPHWSVSYSGDSKVYSTEYDTAYIGLLPGESTFEEASDIKCFVINTPVSKPVTINDTVIVDAKTVNVGYLNVNMFIKDIFGKTSDIKYIVTGNTDSLTYIKTGNSTAYFLRLSTDMLNESSVVSYNEQTYIIKLNPISVSYISDYNEQNQLEYKINIREELTSNSTAYCMYDGGELK